MCSLPIQCHVHRQEGCVRAEHVYVEGTLENSLFSTGTNVMSIDWKSVQMIVRLCGQHACSTCEHFAGTCSEVQTRWKVATNVINNKHSI